MGRCTFEDRGDAIARPDRSRARVLTVDLLRLFATLQMVQGHVIDAVLAPVHREGGVHDTWLWMRGLTSVAFLFAAGLSFHLATLRKLTRHRADPAAVRSRYTRALTLVGVGYALHFPAAYLTSGDPAAQADSLRQALIVDVLQCIGVTLAAMEWIALRARSVGAARGVYAALGVCMLLLSPALASVDPAGPLRPLVNYFTPQGGSIFPLAPWAGHMLLAAALAPWLLDGRPALRFLVAGLAVLGVATLGTEALAPLCQNHLTRLGAVLLLCSACALAERPARRLPRPVLNLASETLFIYVFHIVLAYGQGFGLSDRVGHSLPPSSAAALALGMLVLSCGLSPLYRRTAGGLAASSAPG